MVVAAVTTMASAPTAARIQPTMTRSTPEIASRTASARISPRANRKTPSP
jgi:hypothetical protein